MSGSARSMESSMYAGIRVVRTEFTPEYAKNGENKNAKLVIDGCMNFVGRSGKVRQEYMSFTIWGKLAHTCAKSMSKGKEFHAKTSLNTYHGRGYFKSIDGAPGLPISNPDGTPNMQKKVSLTVLELGFGEEGNKHIANEIQMQIRPRDWNTPGHVDKATWKTVLDARQAIVFNPQSPTYGYATVRMPKGEGISAYIQKADAGTAGVAAAFTGVNPAASVPAASAPVVGEGGFVNAPAGV